MPDRGGGTPFRPVPAEFNHCLFLVDEFFFNFRPFKSLSRLITYHHSFQSPACHEATSRRLDTRHPSILQIVFDACEATARDALKTPADPGPINADRSDDVTNGGSGSFHGDEACWSSFVFPLRRHLSFTTFFTGLNLQLLI